MTAPSIHICCWSVPDQVKKSWYIGMFQIPAAPERLLAGRIGTIARRQGISEDAASRYGQRFSTAEDLRAERLPAALIQGQRDFFGAHTYKRIDKPGTFHTLWGQDRTEVQTD